MSDDTLRLKKNFQPKILRSMKFIFMLEVLLSQKKTCFDAFWRWKFFGVTEGTGVPKMWPLPRYSFSSLKITNLIIIRYAFICLDFDLVIFIDLWKLQVFKLEYWFCSKNETFSCNLLLQAKKFGLRKLKQL